MRVQGVLLGSTQIFMCVQGVMLGMMISLLHPALRRNTAGLPVAPAVSLNQGRKVCAPPSPLSYIHPPQHLPAFLRPLSKDPVLCQTR